MGEWRRWDGGREGNKDIIGWRRTLRRPRGAAPRAEPPLRLTPNLSERYAKSSATFLPCLGPRADGTESDRCAGRPRRKREGRSATFTTALTHPLTLYSLPAWDRLTPSQDLYIKRNQQRNSLQLCTMKGNPYGIAGCIYMSVDWHSGDHSSVVFSCKDHASKPRALLLQIFSTDPPGTAKDRGSKRQNNHGWRPFGYVWSQ